MAKTNLHRVPLGPRIEKLRESALPVELRARGEALEDDLLPVTDCAPRMKKESEGPACAAPSEEEPPPLPQAAES